MCVNKVKMKTAYENNHLSIMHSKHYILWRWDSIFGNLGALAVDKRRKEWLLTISIAFLLLDS